MISSVIWSSHLLKKYLMENFIFCAVVVNTWYFKKFFLLCAVLFYGFTLLQQKEDEEDGISVASFKPKELSFIDNRRAQVKCVIDNVLNK